MMTRPPQSRRASRSNLYSGSKRWMPFSPCDSEIYALPKTLRPAVTVSIGPGQTCPIFVRPLHSAFLRPCSPEDVCNVLTSLPPSWLAGLEGVFLLGGTRKQDQESSGSFRMGSYGGDKIYLHAFPRRRMERHFTHKPKPSIVQEYTRAGAAWEQVSRGWVRRFTADSLRNFYLKDVLIHEVAHHVDRDHRKPEDAAERFAHGFVQKFANSRSGVNGGK